jgi:hypothetical protein
MLRLISKAAPSSQSRIFRAINEKPSVQFNDSSQDSFLFNIHEISQNLYKMRFHDLSHQLYCEITLELKNSLMYGDEPYEEDGTLEVVIAGNFPTIDMQGLNQIVHNNEYLQGMILIKFQLKILEELLLFAKNKDAGYLFLNFNEANYDYVEIYQRFIVSQESNLSASGEQIELVMPTDVGTYDELIEFMDELEQDFQQSLWRDQKSDPIIRQYLKSKALMEF